MTCDACLGFGFVPFVDTANPVDDAAVTREDLLFAVCLCESGKLWRLDRNNGKRVAEQWRVWCVREQIDPSRVFPIEKVYSQEQLRAVGLVAQPASLESRRAALLAEGTKRR
jgi:hypothetical protein